MDSMLDVGEFILGIEEVFEGDLLGVQAGFRITTDHQEILLLIDNFQSCCETWGYMLTEDDPEKFLGEVLLGLRVTDVNRSERIRFTSSYMREAHKDGFEYIHLDAGNTLFVDIITSAGVLQFAAYNSHNGYYGHEAKVISKQLNHQVYL